MTPHNYAWLIWGTEDNSLSLLFGLYFQINGGSCINRPKGGEWRGGGVQLVAPKRPNGKCGKWCCNVGNLVSACLTPNLPPRNICEKLVLSSFKLNGQHCMNNRNQDCASKWEIWLSSVQKETHHWSRSSRQTHRPWWSPHRQLQANTTNTFYSLQTPFKQVLLILSP